MDLCGLRSSPISLTITVNIMLQVLLKWSYFKMECHYSVNQLISETLISVFMEQRVELSTQTHMNYRFYSMENITNNSKDAG